MTPLKNPRVFFAAIPVRKIMFPKIDLKTPVISKLKEKFHRIFEFHSGIKTSIEPLVSLAKDLPLALLLASYILLKVLR